MLMLMFKKHVLKTELKHISHTRHNELQLVLIQGISYLGKKKKSVPKLIHVCTLHSIILHYFYYC